MIDLSFAIGAIIAVILAVICIKVYPIIKASISPATLAVISWFAQTIVRAVEAEFGSGGGEEKREEAFARINKILAPMIELCESMGFTIDAEQIYDAIQAAWLKMNLEQIMAGEKLSKIEQGDLGSIAE